MVDAAINHTAVEVNAPEGRPSDYFGKKVFGLSLIHISEPTRRGVSA